MKIIKFLSAFILASMLLTSGVHAKCNKKPDGTCDNPQGKQYRDKRVQGGDIDYLLSFKELKLNKKQISQLEKLRDDFTKERIRVKAEVKIKRMEVEKLLHDYDVDTALIEKKVKEMSELNAGVLLKATMSRVVARKILTKKQFDLAKELIEEKRGE